MKYGKGKEIKKGLAQAGSFFVGIFWPAKTVWGVKGNKKYCNR